MHLRDWQYVWTDKYVLLGMQNLYMLPVAYLNASGEVNAGLSLLKRQRFQLPVCCIFFIASAYCSSKLAYNSCTDLVACLAERKSHRLQWMNVILGYTEGW